MTDTTTLDPTVDQALAALPDPFRHPHVTRFTIDPHTMGRGTFQAKYEFKSFDGTEDRPERPDGLYDHDLTSVQRKAIIDLYNAMLGAWARAKFTTAVREHLADADAAWQTWTTTEQALTAAYGAFDGLADGNWRATRMALTDLQNTALDAAADFDRAAGAIARLQQDHWHDMWDSMGEWNGDAATTNYDRVAIDLGISTDDWRIGDADAYTGWTSPLTDRTQKTVAEQNRDLALGDLVPLPLSFARMARCSGSCRRSRNCGSMAKGPSSRAPRPRSSELARLPCAVQP
jgi:hypothetical protein